LRGNVRCQRSEKKQTPFDRLQRILECEQSVNVTIRINRAGKGDRERFVVARKVFGRVFKSRTIRRSARIDHLRWLTVTLSIQAAHRRRDAQTRLRLTVNLGETPVEPVAKARRNVSDARPVVMDHEVQRKLSRARDV